MKGDGEANVLLWFTILCFISLVLIHWLRS